MLWFGSELVGVTVLGGTIAYATYFSEAGD
jgi:hypothetical protein